MRDFTVESYSKLLSVLKDSGYFFQTFREYLIAPQERVVILRHDVDKLPMNALRFAQIEHDRGIKASYFFRIVEESFNPSVIRQISALGHEIGYHYEDLDLCRGDVDKAYFSFQRNLAKLREIVPVDTACMHGSPLSRFDNRSIWDKYDYRNDGILGEPYFDLDYTKIFYLTDTGRKWNSAETSIRDKVQSSFQYRINNTKHLIEIIELYKLPNQIMINTHPQRWNDNIILWTRELIWQYTKNMIKRVITKRKLRSKETV